MVVMVMVVVIYGDDDDDEHHHTSVQGVYVYFVRKVKIELILCIYTT